MSTTTAPTATSVRAGDRDRERTANLLGQALAQGYLAMDEYESRLQATFAAHTTAELRRLVTDAYMVQHPGVPERRSIQSVCAHLVALCLVVEHDLPTDRLSAILQRVVDRPPAWRLRRPRLAPAGPLRVRPGFAAAPSQDGVLRSC